MNSPIKIMISFVIAANEVDAVWGFTIRNIQYHRQSELYNLFCVNLDSFKLTQLHYSDVYYNY